MTKALPMPPLGEGQSDIALEAATAALTGNRRQAAGRFASIELRATDPDLSPWRVLAFLASALGGVALVVTLWLI